MFFQKEIACALRSQATQFKKGSNAFQLAIYNSGSIPTIHHTSLHKAMFCDQVY